MESNKKYSINEIAELTKKTIKFIRREVASGNLKSSKKNNKILIDEDAFLEWEKNLAEYELNYEESKDYLKNKQINKAKKEKDIINWIDIKDDMQNIDYWKDKTAKKQYNFIDLFTGAGGLSCGLVMAGFNPVGSVEIMPQAVETYKYNFSKINGFNENVTDKDIREENVKNNLINSVKDKHIHLIAGGFPCQGFSMAGNRIVTDPRNSLYTDMLKIVEKIKPDYVLMENVEGLRSMMDGKIEEKIIEDYKNIGYKINVTVLNAADYGVPQLRKRVIFIGNRINHTNYHPKPIYNENNYKTVGNAIEKYMSIENNKEINHIITTHSPEMTQRLKEIPIGKSLYGNYSDAWKKVDWNKPSCTVKENHGGVNVHPILNRVMTPRELAALQSFPDDFIFKGSKKWQLVQIGNAVPPLLGKAVGLAIMKGLKEDKSNDK